MEERRRRLILRGALDVFGEKGFDRATVQDLIDEAGISRATFYKYFPDREACLAALNDVVLAWLEGEAKEAITSAADWPSQVRAVTERLVGLVAADPRVGRVCGIESMLVSDEIRARRAAALDALASGLRKGRGLSRRGEELPATLEDFLVAGGTILATRSVFGEQPPAKGLGTEVAELILIPYLGRAKARTLVRGT
jgi:AcrR family transcriptional regulator